MLSELHFTVIVGINLYRFKLECFDKIFDKKVYLCGGGCPEIEHVICSVYDGRNRGKRWRYRHLILFNHLRLDLLLLLRRHVATSVAAHPDQFSLLAPCLEHRRWYFALCFAQTDVNQIVP